MCFYAILALSNKGQAGVTMKTVMNIFRKKQQIDEHAKVLLLPVDKIEPSQYQAREVFDETEIKKLAVSILQNGLLQPISVRLVQEGEWQLIAGERRLRACKLAGIALIPAIQYDFEDEKVAVLGLLENLQREQLNPFEQARALRDLISMWNCTQEETAKKLGMAQSTLANKLRLLVFTKEQERLCLAASLSERHARAVLRVPTQEGRTKVIKIIAEKHLNVQQTDEIISKLLAQHNKPKRNVMVSDVRIFVNTINRAIELMTASGIPAHAKRSEQEDFIEYVVRIPTHNATSKPPDFLAGLGKNVVVDVTEEALKSTSNNLIREIEKQVADISVDTA